MILINQIVVVLKSVIKTGCEGGLNAWIIERKIKGCQ
jgi:hypothetical protein